MIHLQLTGATLDGILHLFDEYMAMLNKALMGDDAAYDADGQYSMQRAEVNNQGSISCPFPCVSHLAHSPQPHEFVE